MSHKRLVLGNIDFDETPGNPFAIVALGTDSGTDWGNPEPIEVELRSFLQDGAVIVTEGYGNRELFIAAEVRGADSQAAADAEAALFAELNKRNTLTCYPDDGVADPTVFDVITSSLQFLPDDLRETMQGNYRYLVRLVCEPWARAATETVTPALATGTTTVTVDDCSSTTGWTGSDTVTTNGSSVINTTAATSGIVTAHLERSGAVAMGTTPYLVIKYSAWPLAVVTVSADSTAVTLLSKSADIFGVITATYYRPTDFSVLRINASTSGTAVERVFRCDDVSRTDVAPVIGTARQLLRSLEVGGSARTQGSLQVVHATDALGTVIAYTRPDDGVGYTPALRQFLASSGTTTTDSFLVSGARNDPTTALVYDIPAGSTPDGTLAVYAFVRSTTADNQTFAWSAQARINGVDVGTAQSGTTTVDYIGSWTWQLVPLGHIRTPLTDMPSAGDDAFVRVTIQQTTSTGVGESALDEAYLFEIENGALSIVDCGTVAPSSGGSSNRLWLNSPTVDTPRPTILVGTDADSNDAHYPGGSSVQAFGTHEFKPGQMMVFTVTSNALNAAASLRHYRRGLTFGPQA